MFLTGIGYLKNDNYTLRIEKRVSREKKLLANWKQV
jgi:hypothetical protein